MNHATQKLDEIYARLGGLGPRAYSLAQVRDTAIRMEMEATGYHQAQTAKNLGISRSKLTDWVNDKRCAARQAAAIAVCGFVFVGCAAKPAARLNRTLPPLPSPVTAVSAHQAIKSNRIDSSLIVAPPAPAKPWYFKWTGPTNGWVHVVGRKETLLTPWQEYARVTNRTECVVTPGFYTVLRMEDTDLPGHVWVGR